jgi:hypothetical protein
MQQHGSMKPAVGVGDTAMCMLRHGCIKPAVGVALW